MFHPCNILVVEDDRGSRDALRWILGDQGHHVCAVGSLEQAQAQLDGCGIVLLDLTLPDGSGMSLLRQIRQEHSGARVAILTADDALARASRELAPDAVFIKPVSLGPLLEWIDGGASPGATC